MQRREGGLNVARMRSCLFKYELRYNKTFSNIWTHPRSGQGGIFKKKFNCDTKNDKVEFNDWAKMYDC